MLANNETGVLFPLQEICSIRAGARRARPHRRRQCARQDRRSTVEELGVTLLSLSGHKIYGPKGVGRPVHPPRNGVPACQTGGSQERGRRGGTLNAPGIVGLGMACQVLRERGTDGVSRIRVLRDRLEAELQRRFPRAQIIGAGAERLPNTALVCFPGVSAEPLLILLSEAGICVSGGAACASGSLEPSHVMKAMGIDPRVAQGEVRFSLGRFNTEADLDRLFEVLPAALNKVAASGLC